MAERRGGDVATPFMLCDDSGELYAPNLYPRVPAQLRDPHPVWYSPLRVLGLLSAVSFFIYIDRGVISSNGVQGDQSRGMQHDLHLDLVELGILPGAFMVGLVFASLANGLLTKYTSPFRLIGYGTLIWAAASVGCGLAGGFWSMLVCRILMGIGEASIINLAMPFIDDVAPPLSKTLWFSVFFTAALAMPLTVFFLVVRPLHLHGLRKEYSSDHMEPLLPYGIGDKEKEGLLSDLHCLLWQHPMYLINIIAFCPIQGVFGSYGYWGPKAVHQMLGTREEAVDLTFSIIGTATGILGTLLGGAWLDAAGNDIQHANVLCTVCSAISAVTAVLSFWAATSLASFVLYFTIASTASSVLTGPSSVVTMWGVPQRLRPLAASLGTITLHLLGDVPAPPLVGWLQGYLGDWKVTMSALGAFTVLAAVGYGICICLPVRDYRPREEVVLCRSNSWIGRTSSSESLTGSSRASSIGPQGAGAGTQLFSRSL